jgi:hypothetical protein
MFPNLLDVVRRLDPDGSLPVIAEMMDKVDPIVQDMPMMEGNLQTGHQGTVRSGLPLPAWRLLNYGVMPGKSETKQVIDTCGILEAWGEIDLEVFNLNGAKQSFRLTEDRAHIESIAQELSTTLLYGNTAEDPEKFLGLAPRFNDPSAENGKQILEGGVETSNPLATATKSSIWLISWGERTIHGIYPKGQVGGLDFKDKGIETKEDGSGRLMEVLRSKFVQRIGLHLKDWEGVVRIANVALEDGDGPIDLTSDWPIENIMIQAWYAIPQRLRTGQKMCFYCSPGVKSALVRKVSLTTVANSTLTVNQLENGEPMVRFWGIPVRELDSITQTEAKIAGI